MPIIYNSRYTAQQNVHGGDRIVKVCGGYIIMTQREYQIWRKQK